MVVGRVRHHRRRCRNEMIKQIISMCVLKFKLSFQFIPIIYMYFNSVLFYSEHLKYLHLVWYHLLPLSQEKQVIKCHQDIDCWHKPTSLLYVCDCVCAWVQLSMIAHKVFFAKVIKHGARTCSCTLPCRRSRTCEWQRIQRESYGLF